MFDLEAWLREHTTVHAEHGDERVVPCVCDKGQKAHLWVNVRKCMAICYRCGIKHGDALGIVAQVGGIPLERAKKVVRTGESHDASWHKMHAALQEVPTETQSIGQEVLPLVELPAEYEPIEGKLPAYVRGRGITEKMATAYGLGVCRSGFYGGRLIVPVLDHQKRLVSFVARLMRDACSDVPKVLYPKGTQKARLLFSEHRARAYDMVVVTEGVFDAMRVGGPGVALFGKLASKVQIDRLAALGERSRIVVMLDDDAVQEAKQLARDLVRRGGCEVWVARLPNNRHDPGECEQEEIQMAISNAYRMGHRQTWLQASMGIEVAPPAPPRVRS